MKNLFYNTSNPNDVVTLFNTTNARAVIIDDGALTFDPTEIQDNPQPIDTDLYWRESYDERKKPGPNVYTLETRYSLKTLTPNVIQKEAIEAGLTISTKALQDFYEKSVHAMQLFSQIVQDYTQTDKFYMRCVPVFSPIGGQGRAPILHIDRTPLTGLWYASRAPAQIYTGHIPQEIWAALNPLHNNHHQENPLLQEFTRQAEQGSDLHDLPLGKLIIARNSKEENLLDPRVQRQVCLHRSGDIPEKGQAGIIMTPKFIN